MKKIRWLRDVPPMTYDSFMSILGKGTIVYELMKIILHDSNIFCVRQSFGGKFQFKSHELYIGDPVEMMYEISDKIDLMRHVVYI